MPFPVHAWCAIVVLTAACSSKATENPSVESSWYRATVTNDDGNSASFLLGLPPGARKAQFRSGSYAFEADVSETTAGLKISLPVYGSEIVVARIGSDLVGRMNLFTPFGGAVQLGIGAKPVSGPGTEQLRHDSLFDLGMPLELGGQISYWHAVFDDGDVGKLTLRRVATGAYDAVLELDTGNITNLGGIGNGMRLKLSGFDGTAAFRFDINFFRGYQEGRATWVAGQGLDWHESVRVTRANDFPVIPKVGLNGELVVPEAAMFAGKPIVVEIGASWCSTCRSIAPVLHDLYLKHHSQGLEVLTLLYEFSNDPAYDAGQVLKFKQGYDIPWPVIAVTGNPGERLPAALEDVDSTAFPLLLFIDRAGKLQSMRAGFPMDPTDPAYAIAVQQIGAAAESITRAPRDDVPPP
jgi:thiol-disulfide isomerase/thioredoxin